MVKDISPVEDNSQKAVYQTDREGEGLWTVLKKNKIIVLYILVVSGYYAGCQMYNYLMPLDLQYSVHLPGSIAYSGNLVKNSS